MRKYIQLNNRKGVSDLVVILTLIAISIPVAMAVQNWLGAQASRMNSYVATPELQGVLISKSSSSGETVFILKIKNTGDKNYQISDSSVNASVILKNGSVVNAVFKPVRNVMLKPAESVTGSVIVNVGSISWSDVKTIVLNIKGEDGTIITVNVNVS